MADEIRTTRQHEWIYPDAPSPRQCRWCLKREDEIWHPYQSLGMCPGPGIDPNSHRAPVPSGSPCNQTTTWKPIATTAPPQDGERFVAAARILRTGTKEFLYWQTDVWWFDEGEFRTDADNGIWFDDCEIWCRLPTYPEIVNGQPSI